MAMKMADIQKVVKDNAFAIIMESFPNATQIGNHEISVPYMVDGAERYAKISVVCGQLKDTQKYPAFNPKDAHDNWIADCEYKQKVAETKAKEKAERLAKKSKSKS